MSHAKPRIARLIWDDWNRAHIARHGVTPAEAEDVAVGDALIKETYKQRLRLVGPTTTGRMVAVIIGPVPHEPAVYYVFTARAASRKERRQYAEWKGGPAS